MHVEGRFTMLKRCSVMERAFISAASFAWYAEKTWIAQQWLFMMMRFTADPAMGKNMDPKAMAMDKAQAP